MKLDLVNETKVEIPNYSTTIGVENLSTYSGGYTNSKGEILTMKGNPYTCFGI